MSEVCVHGLGYIGLPTAAVLADSGHRVVGFDTDEAVRASLASGESPIDEPGLDALVARTVADGSLTVADHVPAAEYHVICVPTPFDDERREADLGYVRAAAANAGQTLRRGDVVVLESTVPPGTTTGPLTDELRRASGLTPCEEFSVVHCPETVLPGRMLEELRANDRVIGGIDADSTSAARSLYADFVDGDIVETAGPTAAEFVKLVQNTYRDVNVALANEIAKLAGDYGVDTREAIDVANRHPRVDILQPGPGVGGHCLPVDPWFLGHDSERLDLVARARAVNDGMGQYLTELLEAEVGRLDGRRVAVLGVAYKGNVGDTRGSPGLALARALQSAGATVSLSDPHVDDQALALEPVEAATADADALVFAAAHDAFAALDPAPLADRMRGTAVLDACNVVEKDRMTEAGFTVLTI
ncbi:MAG: nucleotide sugar dehydrogenase [Halobacteriota archaeon]